MVILIGINHKVFLEQEFREVPDPLGGDHGVAIAVMQRYITAFGIPYWGTRKYAKAFSIGTDQPVPVLLWSDTMKYEADRMMLQTSGAWKRRLFGQTMLLALVGLIGYMVFLGFRNTAAEKAQAKYIADPQPGDIVLATESSRGGLKGAHDLSDLFVFRIEEIRGDSLFIRRGLQRIDAMEEYRVRNKEKLIGKFDTGDTAFSPKREFYSVTNYRQGDKRLQLIVKDRKQISREEAARQDSIVRWSDIIEPKYIKRPKK